MSKLPFGAFLVVFAVTFTIWIIFYETDMPLTPPSTAVVAIAVLGAVMFIRLLWARFRKKGEAK